jgi:hypothetical protein
MGDGYGHEATTSTRADTHTDSNTTEDQPQTSAGPATKFRLGGQLPPVRSEVCSHVTTASEQAFGTGFAKPLPQHELIGRLNISVEIADGDADLLLGQVLNG